MINVAKCWGWAADGHSGQSLPCAKSQGQGAVPGVCRDQAPPGVSAVLWWMSVGPGTCPDKAFAAYTNCPYCTPSPVAGSPQGPSRAVPHPHPLAAQALSSFRFCSDVALAYHPATASLCHHRDLPVFYVSWAGVVLYVLSLVLDAWGQGFWRWVTAVSPVRGQCRAHSSPLGHMQGPSPAQASPSQCPALIPLQVWPPLSPWVWAEFSKQYWGSQINTNSRQSRLNHKTQSHENARRKYWMTSDSRKALFTRGLP